MKEYIEREAAIKEIYSEIERTDPTQATEAVMNYSKGLRIAAALVMNASAADVVERVHGEWIMKEHMIRSPYAKNAYCSKCLEETSYAYNFCPNCGADMRGEKHER